MFPELNKFLSSLEFPVIKQAIKQDSKQQVKLKKMFSKPNKFQSSLDFASTTYNRYPFYSFSKHIKPLRVMSP